MAKKETLDLKEKAQLDHVALGVTKNENGAWCVVKVKYDPKTKLAEVEDVVVVGERSEADEKFRILVANDVFTD